MVNNNAEQLDTLFHALADPTRRAMLNDLRHAPLPVSALAAPHAMSLAAASKHVKVLERAGLLRRSVQGRTHLCALNAAPLHTGLEWIRHYEQFWTQRLDALETLLREEDRQTATARKPSRKPTRKAP